MDCQQPDHSYPPAARSARSPSYPAGNASTLDGTVDCQGLSQIRFAYDTSNMALHYAVHLIWMVLGRCLCLSYRTTRDQVNNAQQHDCADERDCQGCQIEHAMVDRDSVPGQ